MVHLLNQQVVLLLKSSVRFGRVVHRDGDAGEFEPDREGITGSRLGREDPSAQLFPQTCGFPFLLPGVPLKGHLLPPLASPFLSFGLRHHVPVTTHCSGADDGNPIPIGEVRPP